MLITIFAIMMIITFLRVFFFIMAHAIGLLGFLLALVLMPLLLIGMAAAGLAAAALVVLAGMLVGTFVLDAVAD